MARATLNFVIDFISLLVMLAMICTGLLIRFILPPGSGQRLAVWDYSRHDWGDAHFWLAVALGVLLLVHVALHWGWVCQVVSRWFHSGATRVPALRRNLIGAATITVLVLTVGGFLWIAQQSIAERDGDEGIQRKWRGGRVESQLLSETPPTLAQCRPNKCTLALNPCQVILTSQ